MSSTVRIEYPDLSTELAPNEFSFTGESVNLTTQVDQRSLVKIEAGDSPATITTGPFDDTITGGAANDTITGGAGNDMITGGAGRDMIAGGAGNDFLKIGFGDNVSGGPGMDTLELDLSQMIDGEEPPIITDFQPGEDRITVLDGENSTAVPVYDRKTGAIFLNGTQVVKLSNNLSLGSDDIKTSGNDLMLSSIDTGETKVYRFFESSIGVHLYTSDEKEKSFIQENLSNYTFEGESYGTVDPMTGNAAESEEVYRFFNSTTGAHLYTAEEKERDFIIENLPGYSYEGVKYYGYETQVEGSIPVYRFYEPSLGVHFYTSDEKEKNSVMENLPNYTFEDVAYYAMPLESDM